MALANMRAQGMRSLPVTRERCHAATMNVDRFAESLGVPAFGPRMGCTCCGIVGADVRPNWLERPARESNTVVMALGACRVDGYGAPAPSDARPRFFTSRCEATHLRSQDSRLARRRRPKPIEQGDRTMNTMSVEAKILAILAILALVAITFLVHVRPTTHSLDLAGHIFR